MPIVIKNEDELDNDIEFISKTISPELHPKTKQELISILSNEDLSFPLGIFGYDAYKDSPRCYQFRHLEGNQVEYLGLAKL
jgi:hypothetical protein